MIHLLLLAAITADPLVETVTKRVDLYSARKSPRVCITGVGPVGNDPTGPMLAFASRGHGLDLGAGDPYRATGNHVSGIKLIKAETFVGGDAIHLEALNGGERPGQSLFDNILIMGESSLTGNGRALWERGIYASGKLLPQVTNANGVRWLVFRTIRITDCMGESILLENATHAFFHTVEIDTGSSGRIPVAAFRDCSHVFLSQANMFGEVQFYGCKVVIFDGYAQTVIVDSKCESVLIRGIVDKLVVQAGATGLAECLSKQVDNKAPWTFKKR